MAWSDPTRTWKYHDPTWESDEVDPKRRSGMWNGHRWFVYDLLRWREPAVVVELGTHYGPSIFAMAQAVKDADLSTSLNAVDTWEGEEHAGFYGEEVFDIVNRVKQEKFPDVRLNLVRKYFSDALGQFEDGTVDLIHIDGFHSYEAAKQDFESWLPKLSKNSLVILHDASRTLGYGSAQYCEEIVAKYGGFIFPHSCGLAVVAPKGEIGWEALFDPDSIDAMMRYYPSRGEAFLATLQVIDQAGMIDDRDAAIVKQTEMIDERDLLIREQQALIEELSAKIERLKRKLKQLKSSPRAALDVIVTRTPLAVKKKLKR